MSDQEAFPNLEKEHNIKRITNSLGQELIVVICPVTNPDTGHKFESSWSAKAEDWEINCLFCEEVENIKQDEPQFDHGCYDSGDREEGEDAQ